MDNNISKCTLCGDYTDTDNELCYECSLEEFRSLNDSLASDDFFDNNVNIDYYDYTQHESYKEEE